MSFVLDASITACWAFPDEDHPDAGLAFRQMRTEEARVPCPWWFEVRNILVVNERRRRIAESDTARFPMNLSRLRIRIDRDPDEGAVPRLARTHRLPVYDAAYLELAQREGLPLATLDTALEKAAACEGVARQLSCMSGDDLEQAPAPDCPNHPCAAGPFPDQPC